MADESEENHIINVWLIILVHISCHPFMRAGRSQGLLRNMFSFVETLSELILQFVTYNDIQIPHHFSFLLLVDVRQI